MGKWIIIHVGGGEHSTHVHKKVTHTTWDSGSCKQCVNNIAASEQVLEPAQFLLDLHHSCRAGQQSSK